MKPNPHILKTVPLAAAALLASHLSSSAATLTALDPTALVENVNSIPSTTQGPSNTGTTGTDGYSVFGNSTTDSTSSLPGYVSSVTPTGSAGEYRGGDNSTITLSGDTVHSGFTQAYTSNGNVYDLALIALTGSVPSTFDLGLLTDNSNQNYPTAYTLSLYSGDPSAGGTQVGTTLDVNTTASSRSVDNDFYYASVSGASSGDFLVVQGYTPAGFNSTNAVELGGVTFDTVVTPEPSTFALMFAGLGVLLLVARTRRGQA